ncbi:family 1 glycosylhydrolase [Nakamurella sp. A5-74]|uniref:Family 1 glycosylhydrolase n=1 Tax=Nakamurella sp. A5-74 TaxID=3158264 RepID=A0AAU8DUZ4_9ACTN
MAGLMFGVASTALSVDGADGAGEAPRADTVWDTFAAAGRTADGTGPRSAPAQRIETLLPPVQELGVREFRFGVNWARVRPDGVHTEQAALDSYERWVDLLLGAGIEPVLTLHHGDLPLELMLGGGWLERDTSALFGEYAADVAGRLGDRVSRWVTMVDPFGTAFHGYGFGVDAPGIVLLGGAFTALHHALLGHGTAVDAIRTAAGREVRVGPLADHTVADPATPSDADRTAAAWYDSFHNELVAGAVLDGHYPAAFDHLPGAALDAAAPEDAAVISAPLDFYGVRFEFGRTIAAAQDNSSVPFSMVEPDDVELTAAGWPVRADDLHRSLVMLHRRHALVPPIRVEVGASFTGPGEDERRARHLREHLEATESAVRQGVPVESFAYGHLTDGWEFGDGMTRPSGLIAVDPQTGTATPRPVLQHYRELVRSRTDPGTGVDERASGDIDAPGG